MLNHNYISGVILDACIRIHSETGPGLLESVYETILADELRKLGMETFCQVPIPIKYRNRQFDQGFRADMIVGGCVLVELKSIENLSKVHHKQVLTYLRLSGFQLGLLINFGVPRIVEGFHRIVNRLPDESS